MRAALFDGGYLPLFQTWFWTPLKPNQSHPPPIPGMGDFQNSFDKHPKPQILEMDGQLSEISLTAVLQTAGALLEGAPLLHWRQECHLSER